MAKMKVLDSQRLFATIIDRENELSVQVGDLLLDVLVGLIECHAISETRRNQNPIDWNGTQMFPAQAAERAKHTLLAVQERLYGDD